VTAGFGRMPTGAPPFIARLARFQRVGSTNDVVRDWLAAGVEEVAIAVADEQAAGRGRGGRTWTAPAGAALLVSAGFRPGYLPPDRAWRLAAIVALAMADAAEDAAGLGTGTIRLKWPNDLVIVAAGPGASLRVADAGAAEALARLSAPLEIRKLAGILGETEGLGTDDPRAVVGIGINADWPAADFPADLAGSMTSLRDASGGGLIDRDALLDGFLDRLETRLEALRGGRFDVAGWAERQVTTGRLVRLEGPGGAAELVRATGVDGASGAILVEEPDRAGGGAERAVLVGEISHLRLPTAGAV
jgi:BirA family transcriptional regulator, biotin operon repressor / biotin---[acetyl-CoA-carboxylase] ligase